MPENGVDASGRNYHKSGMIKNYKQWTKGSELIEENQQHSRNYRLPTPAISRRLLFASSSSSAVGTSQNILQLHVTQRPLPSRRHRTNMARTSRGAGSMSSRHTSSVAGPPLPQRRTEFSTTTERFLRVEEQQLGIQRLNAQILQSFLERNAKRDRAMDERGAERDRAIAEAVAAVGKGLQALAEAKNRD